MGNACCEERPQAFKFEPAEKDEGYLYFVPPKENVRFKKRVVRTSHSMSPTRTLTPEDELENLAKLFDHKDKLFEQDINQVVEYKRLRS